MKSIKTAFKWALLYLLAMLAWMGLEKLTGLHGKYIHWHPYLTMLWFIPAIWIYVLALRACRGAQNPYSWFQGFLAGVWITAFITLLSPGAQWVVSEVITPDYFDKVIAYVTQHGMMTEAQASAQFNLKSYMVQSTVGALVVGLVLSALLAIFLRRKAKPLEA